MPDYEFDIAFSFHSLDESIANQLNDLVQDRYKTFLYSKQQEMLAGTDGEAKFNAVFGEKARLVVVLCRAEWGETPFTRFEQTAIRNRGFDDGYDFTLFIPMDKPPTVPKWLPKNRLWLGIERFGLNAAAAVIDVRAQEAGIEVRTESVKDRAARFQRQQDFQTAKAKYFASDRGVAEANTAYEKLKIALESDLASITKPDGLPLMQCIKPGSMLIITGLSTWLHIYWINKYINTLDKSFLEVRVLNGFPEHIPGYYPPIEKPSILNSASFTYELITNDRASYVIKNSNRSFTPEALSEYILKLYMDVSAKQTDRH